MMYRFSGEYLQQWLKKKRRKPLILRGARQVGKSTIVRMFAQQNRFELCEINLEQHMYLNDIFKTLDIEYILQELEAVLGTDIRKPGALLFLDEIQATPYALQSLRYFYEQRPSILVIAAGSLLEFTLADHHFSMPVGRIEYYYLGPMTFKEFLNAVEPGLGKYITGYEIGKTMPVSAHEKLKKRQRQYFFTGGMPEAVLAFKETGSFTEVSEVHRSIAETYQDDFSKYAKQKELALLQKVFRYLPMTLGKKIKYSNISSEHKAKKIKTAIDLLEKARICHRIYHTHCSGLPLYADINERAYKIVFMDIGIVNHICGNDWIYINSFMEKELVNEGALAEQFIGQHLIAVKNQAPQLCYWLREGKSANAEVDYVISQGNLILPVEVKNGKSGSLKSLHQFVLQKKTDIAVRFDMNMPGIQEVEHTAATKLGNDTASFELLSLPLYMVEELPRLIDQIRIGLSKSAITNYPESGTNQTQSHVGTGRVGGNAGFESGWSGC
ncbi:ATP-binding protein [Desulfobacterales bacterium HSG17]|nr:ATP-binding protein [Desulfobacterales bacterium HSG17]